MYVENRRIEVAGFISNAAKRPYSAGCCCERKFCRSSDDTVKSVLDAVANSAAAVIPETGMECFLLSLMWYASMTPAGFPVGVF